MLLRSLFQNRRARRREEGSNRFDIFHTQTLQSQEDATGRSLGDWSPADASAVETAPRFILALWRTRPGLRGRLSDALRNPRFLAEVQSVGASEFSLKDEDLARIASAFLVQAGEAIWQFYLHHPEIQERHPLGLLPFGQKKFVRWLLTKGSLRYGFSAESILWFLHQAVEDLPRGIAQTYLIHPQWQQSFPEALLPSRQGLFLKNLRKSFPSYLPLEKVDCLPFDPPKKKDLGVNVLGHFCYPSGLQQAALTMKSAAELVDIGTAARDVPSGVATELEPRDKWLGLEIYPVTLFCVAPVPHFATCYTRAGLQPRQDVYRIASWYWELESVPETWKEYAEFIDEIWAPTPFVANALRATMPVPVIEMLPGVSIGEIEEVSRVSLGIASDVFLFLFMFDMCSEMERKNPIGLMRAFRLAFSRHEKAILLIKTTRAKTDAEGWERLQAMARECDVLLLDELSSRARAYGFISACDCFVSLHRSEGFGLGLAEAMLLEKPVIATNYSGNLSFMNSENSRLVSYDLIPIEKSGPIYKAGNRWACPSEEHAAGLMRQVFDHPMEARHRAVRARQEVSGALSLQSAGRRIESRLQEIVRQREGRGMSKIEVSRFMDGRQSGLS
jgi:glycosyltransferase involved in cell wall biosynthesis